LAARYGTVYGMVIRNIPGGTLKITNSGKRWPM